MTARAPLNRIAARSGLRGLYLVGSIVGLFVVASLVSVLPIHVPIEPDVLLRPVVMIIGCGIGGALWGRALGRIARYSPRRLMWAGAVSFGPATGLAIFALTALEGVLVERHGSDLPVHVLFGMLFVGATFFVAAAVGFVCGLAVGNWRFALLLALGGGIGAGGAFLVADVVQDLLGRRVGGPGAGETLTMLSVMAIGDLAAAIAGSAVIGVLLSQHRAVMSNDVTGETLLYSSQR